MLGTLTIEDQWGKTEEEKEKEKGGNKLTDHSGFEHVMVC